MENTVMESIDLTKVADLFSLSEEELLKEAIELFLLQKKREIQQVQQEILSQYGVTSREDLKQLIFQNKIEEYPALEDVIVTENLTGYLDLLDVYLGNLSSVKIISSNDLVPMAA